MTTRSGSFQLKRINKTTFSTSETYQDRHKSRLARRFLNSLTHLRILICAIKWSSKSYTVTNIQSVPSKLFMSYVSIIYGPIFVKFGKRVFW
jgi:hypothetical protein